MSELIVANKSDITNIADAVRLQTGKTGLLSLADIEKTVSNGIGLIGQEPGDNDIPKVFINGEIPTTKTDVLAELTYISKTHTFHSYITIKCQGTSSMKYPKKNFTIKLYKDESRDEKLKINFRDWGEQNKFCLKANWIDISHSRNVVSARLWSDLVKSRSDYDELPELLTASPNNGAIDGFPIKVYNNGIYQGRYTWNIPKDSWMTNMDDSLDTHTILCGENYDGGCFRTLPIIDGTDWSDEIHEVCPDIIKDRWSETVNFIINSTDEEFKLNLSDYFDIQSLLDYHIFGIAMCGLDSYGKNQIYMTYDGIKWMASMYDMDSTWGLYWNGETMVSYDYSRDKFEDSVQGRQGNLLYERIEKNFYSELLYRWNELKIGPLSIVNIINRFESFIDNFTSDLIKEDFASTTAGGAYTGIPSVAKNNIQQIRNFAVNRLEYADNYFNDLIPIERIPCEKITLSTNNLVFNGIEQKTITVTLEPSETTDKVIWNSENSEVATVKNGIVTSVFNGNTVVTAVCGDQTASCSITVSGVEIPDYPDQPEIPDEALLYDLPEVTVFDGTNYIDTGVAPLAEDLPFTVLLDWTHTGESEFKGSAHVIAHCMTENAPYPGLILQYGTNGIVSEYRQGTNTISSNSLSALIANEDLYRAKIVFRKESNETITVARCYNENGQIHLNTKQIPYVQVPEELRLGCFRGNVGNTGRFAKGILNECKVYNYAISDEDMNSFLTL